MDSTQETRRNRNRVLKLSTSHRNSMVKHEPELHRFHKGERRRFSPAHCLHEVLAVEAELAPG